MVSLCDKIGNDAFSASLCSLLSPLSASLHFSFFVAVQLSTQQLTPPVVLLAHRSHLFRRPHHHADLLMSHTAAASLQWLPIGHIRCVSLPAQHTHTHTAYLNEAELNLLRMVFQPTELVWDVTSSGVDGHASGTCFHRVVWHIYKTICLKVALVVLVVVVLYSNMSRNGSF